jgi:hypothetical protein
MQVLFVSDSLTEVTDITVAAALGLTNKIDLAS